MAVVFVVRFAFVNLDNKIIPNEFLEARNGASLIARNIVDSSDESAKKIEEISKLSNEEKYEEALNIVLQEINRNKETRNKAIELSKNLEKMVSNTAQISPESSALIAIEAITIETTIINKLITYNDDLMQLLGVLKTKLLELDTNSHQKIIDLVNKLNNEAKEVNASNEKFNEIMDKFDNSK
ncbi:hypothetical protein COV23_01885 [Candidatus Wolfebacteria bacterium CG10_big_fil_rev_8_21_14_0_10_31_9]|uniref:DUF5667 domain-containing protein n=1 Tax=Candidatus Wolfebacteria bacterium CG10_big_fil_rev_8_21_14_0_10_31_9 TaxID=1975070 RepID=A0A2H0RC22_9BACT|nr:MAG: hypothetical protein COV23_01885 [Candidatus Wolfebacteria bacterium CG10_big_fil_rev_8_21_14_0_10_31_9]